jgi:hypothetical protein
VNVVGEGDSCVKKKESAAAEEHAKRNCAVNGHCTQSIKSRRTNNASDVCRKAMRQTEQRNEAGQ